MKSKDSVKSRNFRIMYNILIIHFFLISPQIQAQMELNFPSDLKLNQSNEIVSLNEVHTKSLDDFSSSKNISDEIVTNLNYDLRVINFLMIGDFYNISQERKSLNLSRVLPAKDRCRASMTIYTISGAIIGGLAGYFSEKSIPAGVGIGALLGAIVWFIYCGGN